MKQINIFTLCSETTIEGTHHFQDIVVNDTEYSGYITIDATEESLKLALDTAMTQLQSLQEDHRNYGFGDGDYYDSIQDFMDQIAQLVCHAKNLPVSFEVQKYIDTTVAFWKEI